MFTMWGKTSPCVLLLVACLAVVGHTVASSEHVNCMLGADGTNDALASCLQKGDDFLRAYYTKRVKGGKDDFETCGNYEEFRSCITPLLAQCDSVRYSLEDSWLPIVSLFSCACNDTKRCQESLRCFEEESNDLLVERCDALYKFNLRQHTRDKCYFLQQNVKCKEVLVRTGCGAEAGLFAFHVAKMFRRKKLEKMEMNKMSCPVSRDIHYDDFEYTEACPRSFKEKLSTCEDLFITDSRLVFYEDNELVADARNKGVKKACRGFREYRRCVRPIKDTCPLGTDVIYEYNSELRTYLMKLDFICRMARTDYLSNLQCYQDVLYNRTLMSCNPIWEDLEPWLNRVTSYSFYCQRQDGDTKMLQRKIDKLRVCYTDVFKTKCGDNAGDVIGQLIAKAFQDPFYLRMQYRPHCSRHKRPKIPVAHATNEQLITKTFGGSFVEENSPGVETTTRTYKREAVRTRSDTSSSARSGSTTAHASVALLYLLVVVGLW